MIAVTPGMSPREDEALGVGDEEIRPIMPSIEECIFGPSLLRPKIVDEFDGSENDVVLTEEASDTDGSTAGQHSESDQVVDTSPSSSLRKKQQEKPQQPLNNDYDSFSLGRWGEIAQQHDINLAQLRKLAGLGIPDEGSFRGISWRVLLHFLPPKNINETWSEQVPGKREFYRNLVKQYFQTSMESGTKLTGKLDKKSKENKRKGRRQNKQDALESSLSSPSSSPIITPGSEIEQELPPKYQEQWRRTGITLEHMTTATSEVLHLRLNCLKVPDFTDDSPQEDFDDFLEDATLLEEIRKDVARTLPHLLFFLETKHDLGVRRYAALERILFLWAKLNKGVRYVQGMNEIAGTLYYVLANDDNAEWAHHAETDTYFLFHALMMEIRDVFVPDMDAHTTGIQGRIGNMQRLLQSHDPIVADHLESCGIDSHFYAYRWLTTLLSREFLLPDTIRLWDSMFASTHKENFLRFVCVTMVMHVRDELLEGDFSTNLRLLQRYPPTNVDEVLRSSRNLWMYETQIGVTCKAKGISWQEAIQIVSPPPGIIYAYGHKGGLAPNLQGRVEHAAGHLLGRAQKLWNGWNKDGDDSQDKAQNQEQVSTTGTPSFSPGPRSNLWNRLRRNTNDSDDNMAIIKESESSSPVIGRVVSSVSSASAPPVLGSTGMTEISRQKEPSIPRRKIWNQSPSARTPDNSTMPTEVQLPGSDVANLPNLQNSTNGNTTSNVESGKVQRFWNWNKGKNTASS